MPHRRSRARVLPHASQPRPAWPESPNWRRSVRRALCYGAAWLTWIGCGDSIVDAAPAGSAAAVSMAALIVDETSRSAPPVPGSASGQAAPNVAPPVPTCPPSSSAPPMPCDGPNAITASGLTPSRRVDYLAVRVGNAVQSTTGVACATARNRTECEAAARVPFDGSHLLTTEGDQVRIWSAGPAHTFLLPIDTVAEVLWVMAARGYTVTCGAAVIETPAGFQIGDVARSGSCGGIVRADVVVDSAGNIVETRILSAPQGDLARPAQP